MDMEEFLITVQRTVGTRHSQRTIFGEISQTALTEDEAISIIENGIVSGNLQTTDPRITWESERQDDEEYIDFSFEVSDSEESY